MINCNSIFFTLVGCPAVGSSSLQPRICLSCAWTTFTLINYLGLWTSVDQCKVVHHSTWSLPTLRYPRFHKSHRLEQSCERRGRDKFVQGMVRQGFGHAGVVCGRAGSVDVFASERYTLQHKTLRYKTATALSCKVKDRVGRLRLITYQCLFESGNFTDFVADVGQLQQTVVLMRSLTAWVLLTVFRRKYPSVMAVLFGDIRPERNKIFAGEKLDDKYREALVDRFGPPQQCSTPQDSRPLLFCMRGTSLLSTHVSQMRWVRDHAPICSFEGEIGKR